MSKQLFLTALGMLTAGVVTGAVVTTVAVRNSAPTGPPLTVTTPSLIGVPPTAAPGTPPGPVVTPSPVPGTPVAGPPPVAPPAVPVAPGPSAVPGPAPTPPPPAAPAAPVDDGRRPVAGPDLKKSPYCYIGRIVNDMYPDGLIGTATLIGPRKIVTAKHVIEAANRLPGEMLFVLPNGDKAVIENCQLDGGLDFRPFLDERAETDRSIDATMDKLDALYQAGEISWARAVSEGVVLSCFDRLTSWGAYDLAVCSLDKAVGDSGHAEWGTFEDSHLGAEVNLTGYDGDNYRRVRRTEGRHDGMTTRKGIAGNRSKYTVLEGQPLLFAGISALSARYVLTGGKWTKTSKGAFVIAGTIFLIDAELTLAVKRNNWLILSAAACKGASGGPLWITDASGKPLVIGVQSGVFFDGVKDDGTGTKVPYGVPYGCRINDGQKANMIRDFKP